MGPFNNYVNAKFAMLHFFDYYNYYPAQGLTTLIFSLLKKTKKK